MEVVASVRHLMKKRWWYLGREIIIGMRLFGVPQDGPCHKAGLKSGDIIREAGDISVNPDTAADKLLDICLGKFGSPLKIERLGPSKLINLTVDN